MPKPLLGNQIIQDTFEKLQDQAKDIPDAIQDVVAGQDSGKGDSGIELQGGKTDPAQIAQQAQKQGLTPQQVAEKRAEEKKTYEFHEQRIKEWEEHYKQGQQEKEMKEKQSQEQEQAQKQQEIVQLQEEESKAAALGSQKSSKSKGPGSAFVTQSTKSQTEYSKMPTN